MGDYKDALVEALQCFKCCKDLDVQDFLNSKALDFEKRGWATTYLLLSKDAFDNGKLYIEGYFSLTHKAVVFNDGVSLSSRKKLAGDKKSGNRIFVLIGQFGKRIEHMGNGAITSSHLKGVDLLNDAMSIIEQSSDYIICRNIMIECKPIDKVKSIYKSYGFTDLQYDESESLYTLYLRTENRISF